MDINEKVLRKEQVYEGILVNIERWQVELPDGKPADREIVRHIGAAAIVPLDAEGNVYLVEQWRTPFDRAMLEIPAGKLDYPGEDPLDCAKRELEEETGMRAASWRKLSALIMSPGYLTERIGLYLAQELAQGEAHPDEDEFLNLRKMPLSDAIAMAQSGGIDDAKTIAGLYMAARELGI